MIIGSESTDHSFRPPNGQPKGDLIAAWLSAKDYSSRRMGMELLIEMANTERNRGKELEPDDDRLGIHIVISFGTRLGVS